MNNIVVNCLFVLQENLIKWEKVTRLPVLIMKGSRVFYVFPLCYLYKKISPYSLSPGYCARKCIYSRGLLAYYTLRPVILESYSFIWYLFLSKWTVIKREEFSDAGQSINGVLLKRALVGKWLTSNYQSLYLHIDVWQYCSNIYSYPEVFFRNKFFC